MLSRVKLVFGSDLGIHNFMEFLAGREEEFMVTADPSKGEVVLSERAATEEIVQEAHALGAEIVYLGGDEDGPSEADLAQEKYFDRGY